MKRILLFILLLCMLTKVTYAVDNHQIPTFMNPEITGDNNLIKEEIIINNINHNAHILFHTNPTSTDRIAFLPYFGSIISEDQFSIKSDNIKLPYELLFIDSLKTNPSSYKDLRLHAIEDIYRPKNFQTTDKIYQYEITKQYTPLMPLRINAPHETNFYLPMDMLLAPINATNYRINSLEGQNSMIYSTKPLKFHDKYKKSITLNSKETTIQQMIQKIIGYQSKNSKIDITHEKYLQNIILFQLDQQIENKEFVHYFETLVENHNTQSLIKFTIPKGIKITDITIPISETYDSNQSIILNQTYFGTIGNLKLKIIPSKEYRYINNSSVPFKKDHTSFVAQLDNPTIEQIHYRYSPGNTVMETSKFFILLSLCNILSILCIIFGFYLHKKEGKSRINS